MRMIILSAALLIGLYVHGQTCRDSLRSYIATLDTTERRVVLFAEDMPDILKDQSLHKKISSEIKLTELSCCPINVWFAFVVEQDGTLSNILICPQFIACDSADLITKNTERLTNQFTRLFTEIKTSPGKIRGEPVAVAHISKIHYECSDY